MRNQSPISQLINLYIALEKDKSSDADTNRARDRRIGLKYQTQTLTELQTVQCWLSEHETAEPTTVGETCQKIISASTMILSIFGFFIGWGLSQIVLHYDGNQPVNIIHAVLTLIGFQFAILLLLLSCLIPSGFNQKLKETVLVFNPGFWAMQALGKIIKKIPTELPVHQSPLVAIKKYINKNLWINLLISISQSFAFWLNLGMISSLYYLVFSTDLALGWNTTLNFGSDQIHGVTSIISYPWQSFFPTGVPSEALVEISRYYRLENGVGIFNDKGGLFAKHLGEWWLFLFLSLLFYGLLPRTITLVMMKLKIIISIRKEMLGQPEVRMLLSRINQPHITTQSQTNDETPIKARQKRKRMAEELLTSPDSVILMWSDAILSAKQIDQINISSQRYLNIGGDLTPSQQQQIVQSIGVGSSSSALIVVKGWEAPMMEFSDFLNQLRLRFPEPYPIAILLTPLAQSTLSEANIESWETLLSHRQDENLYIEKIQ
ncbi:MAG: DUF2868 domain-containing protein [Gammaproteobacteria bacterium]|nr:DUF2868 domain-containing protein [Gammaproteobacteria bacterium]